MSFTLKDLKTELRLRIGEPTDGTVGSSVTYQDETGVDEATLALNLAHKKVCDDALSIGYALLQGRKNMAVVNSTREYSLPSDFSSVLDLFHLHDGSFYRLSRHPLRMMKDRLSVNTTGTTYTHYDVFGRAGDVLVESTVTTGLTSSFVDSLKDFTSGALGAVGDIVFNLTDGSYGTITVVSGNTVTVDGLVGGRNNEFDLNDRYHIETKEKILDVLHVYPAISAGSDLYTAQATTSWGSNATLSWTPTDEVILYSITVTLGSTISSPARVSIFQSANATIGSGNEAVFAQGVKLDAGVAHHITVVDSLGASVTPTSYSIKGYTGSEELELHYSRVPMDMSALTDYSELPDWAKEAVLLWAIYLSTCKMFGGESNQSAQARTQYEFELQKVKRFMRVKDMPRKMGTKQTTEKISASGNAVIAQGTSTQIHPGASAPCNIGITLKSLTANSVDIFVGGIGVSTTSGFAISPGNTVTLKLDNIQDIYAITTTGSQILSYIGM